MADTAFDDEERLEEAFERLEAQEQRSVALQTFLTKTMAGELTKARPLKYWENLRLKPRHLQMILMSASGYKNQEIAAQMHMTEARVSVILNHPDARMLLSQLVSYSAENLLDIRTRISAHAGEALDTVLHVMRNTRDDRVRSNTGFELLKMAGYGAAQKVEVQHGGAVELRGKDTTRLLAALEESAEVQDADYEVFLEKETGYKQAPTQHEMPVDSHDESDDDQQEEVA